MLPINGNQALFSLLGTTFGGNGETDFALPDLRQLSVPVGTQYCICVHEMMPFSAPGQGEAEEGDASTPTDETGNPPAEAGGY